MGVGIVATTSMVIPYALEKRPAWFIAVFALASAVGSAYGFAIEAWPFGVVETVWSLVAARRFVVERRVERGGTVRDPDGVRHERAE